MIAAAESGHIDVMRLLLGFPRFAPRADCDDGMALVKATGNGHYDAVELLLGWPKYPPFANSSGTQGERGQALVEAAKGGHTSVMQLLLGQAKGAASANCQYGKALVEAASRGHFEAARLLLEWPGGKAPYADTRGGRALFTAAERGDNRMLRLLLESTARVERQIDALLAAGCKAQAESMIEALDAYACPDPLDLGYLIKLAEAEGHKGTALLLSRWFGIGGEASDPSGPKEEAFASALNRPARNGIPLRYVHLLETFPILGQGHQS